jgi:hypothetical protein
MKVSACLFSLAGAGLACVARGESEALRAQLSAQLSAPSLCIGTSCPSSAYNNVGGICCLGSLTLYGTCVPGGGASSGSDTVICGGLMTTCGAIPSCTGSTPVTLPPTNLCPAQASASAAQSYCTSVGGVFNGGPTLNGCGVFTCLPACTAGVIAPAANVNNCPSSGNFNVPAIFLAVLGTLAAAML